MGKNTRELTLEEKKFLQEFGKNAWRQFLEIIILAEIPDDDKKIMLLQLPFNILFKYCSFLSTNEKLCSQDLWFGILGDFFDTDIPDQIKTLVLLTPEGLKDTKKQQQIQLMQRVYFEAMKRHNIENEIFQHLTFQIETESFRNLQIGFRDFSIKLKTLVFIDQINDLNWWENQQNIQTVGLPFLTSDFKDRFPNFGLHRFMIDWPLIKQKLYLEYRILILIFVGSKTLKSEYTKNQDVFLLYDSNIEFVQLNLEEIVRKNNIKDEQIADIFFKQLQVKIYYSASFRKAQIEFQFEIKDKKTEFTAIIRRNNSTPGSVEPVIYHWDKLITRNFGNRLKAYRFFKESKVTLEKSIFVLSSSSFPKYSDIIGVSVILPGKKKSYSTFFDNKTKKLVCKHLSKTEKLINWLENDMDPETDSLCQLCDSLKKQHLS